MRKSLSQLVEFITLIERDDSLYFCEKYISKLIHAPHMGYTTWLVKYKDIWVAVFDNSNGHYGYFTRVGYIQVLKSKLMMKGRKLYENLFLRNAYTKRKK